ncbi:MAG: hypothetical protein WBG86_03005, partial [Polyangiales bacterium]
MTIVLMVAVFALGCGDSAGEVDDFEATVEHTFEAINVESGSDDYWCQSWTLDNDDTMYVNRVRQINDGAWHHSNWYFVPDDVFGPDGTWKCADRGFTQAQAALTGGVIFAQSTQSFEETQTFPPGTVVVVPPRSKIIGNVHLFNAAASPISTTLTMGIQAIEEEEVEVKLREVSFALNDIAIDPQRRSRWSQTCDLGDLVDDSFNVYYVLGHYHQWGTSFDLSFVDDQGAEASIVSIESGGDNLGVTLDPPVNSAGARSLKYTCGYNNTTDRTLVWGNSGDEEMCQFLAYIDGDLKIGAFPEGETPELMGETDDGVLMYEVSCGDA